MAKPFKTAILVTALVAFAFSHAVLARTTGPDEKDKDTPPKGSKAKSSEPVSSEAGLNIPEWGVAIDAVYDKRLDNLIHGYHLLNIVLTNRGDKDITLDVIKDKWRIVDSFGKKHTAYNHIKLFNSKLWDKLPDDFKDKVDYPQVVRPGKSTTVDVYLPISVSLSNFKEIIWKSYHFDKEFNIFTNYEKILDVSAEGNAFDTPTPDRIKWDKKGDLKTREEILNPSAETTGDPHSNESDIPDIKEAETLFDPALDPIILH